MAKPLLLGYLEELGKDDFGKFKNLLKQEILRCQLKPIHSPELTMGSRKDLAALLEKSYPESQVWEMTLSIFLQLNQRNLWVKAKKGRIGKTNPYKTHMKQKFDLLWERETCLPVPDFFYKETIKMAYEEVKNAFTFEETSKGPITVVLRGPEGIGKTTLLQKVMLEWAGGSCWRDTFTFVFFLDAREMSHVKETSLVRLLSQHWPESSEPIENIFSQPQDILFIVDGFEDFELGPTLDDDGTCDDWSRDKAVEVVVSSLLQKKMLPDASLLLAVGPVGFKKMNFLLQHPKYVVLRGFLEQERKSYFSHFFHDTHRAMAAFSFVRERTLLFSLCQNPLLCWLVCSCIKWQLERGEHLKMTYQNTTSLLVSLLLNVEKAGGEDVPRSENIGRIKRLCCLALSGLWAHTYLFGREDLEAARVSESDLSMWLKVSLLRKHGDCVTFMHRQIQEFCAALYCYLEPASDLCALPMNRILHLVLLNDVYRDGRALNQMKLALIGLLTEKLSKTLERYGFQLADATKKTVMVCLREISLHKTAHQDFQEFFHLLFETQEQKFVARVIGFSVDLTVHIDNTRGLIESSYCLANSRSLQTLSVCLENVFSDDSGSISMNKKLTFWENFCSVFRINENLHVLELNNCSFSDASLEVLCKAMAWPVCTLKTLSLCFLSGFGDGVNFFNAICQNSHLKCLNLHGICLSNTAVRELCETLKHPQCNIEKLMLGNCDITYASCENIVSVLLCNKKLKHLSFLQNSLKDEGVRMLCDVLKHPNCALEKLILNMCCLSSISCDYIYDVLCCNSDDACKRKNSCKAPLALLDLGLNVLGDRGISSLCKALKNPSCHLRELWLMGCLLTPDGCKDLSSVLTNNTQLATLKLGNNQILDDGVKQLCVALKNPRCEIQNLGLEMCGLTAACIKDLASALTICKTLTILNLDGIALDYDGVSQLCEALTDPQCHLHTLGLDKSVFSEESALLLESMKERNPRLAIAREV